VVDSFRLGGRGLSGVGAPLCRRAQNAVAERSVHYSHPKAQLGKGGVEAPGARSHLNHRAVVVGPTAAGTADQPSTMTVATTIGRDRDHDGGRDDDNIARCQKQPRYHPGLGLARRHGVEGAVATATDGCDDGDIARRRQQPGHHPSLGLAHRLGAERGAATTAGGHDDGDKRRNRSAH
jgi:hypothetical protein